MLSIVHSGENGSMGYRQPQVNLEITETEDTTLVPERNLWAAVLDRAISDLVNGGTTILGKEDARTAKYFLLYSPIISNPEFYSFTWICRQLDLDPYMIRCWIRKVLKGEKEYELWHNRRFTRCRVPSDYSNL